MSSPINAQAQRLTLRVVSCAFRYTVIPRLLEQMIRNLLANALKYTKSGKVLLGCRRRQGILSIEICDTGVGIPGEELQSDLRRVPSGRQFRARTEPWPWPRSLYCATLGEFAGPSSKRPLHPGRGSVFAIEIMLPRAERHHGLNTIGTA